MFKVILTTVTVYFLLIITVRLMGKRQIGELQISEMITTILLSEIASAPVIDRNYPLVYAVAASGVILFFEIVIPVLMSRFSFLKRILEGKPSYLIYKGKLSQSEMKRSRITIEELLASLRSSNISDISELDYLILEPNGQLSSFPKITHKNVTISDLNDQTVNEGIAHALVLDGRLCKKTLCRLNISENFVLSVLERNKCDIKNALLLTINDVGEINFIRKEQRSSIFTETKNDPQNS